MSGIGLVATAHYLPERVMSAAEIADASGIPESVVIEKFGLRGKHVAGPDEHVSDLAVAAASRLLDEQSIDPASIGALVYYGSIWKDYDVWQVAPWIAHRLRCTNAYAIEYDNVSMGTPVALRLGKAFLTAEPELGNVLLVPCLGFRLRFLSGCLGRCVTRCHNRERRAAKQDAHPFQHLQLLHV